MSSSSCRQVGVENAVDSNNNKNWLTDASDLQKERRALDTKRLDLDAAKSRLRRAKSQQTRDSVR